MIVHGMDPVTYEVICGASPVALAMSVDSRTVTCPECLGQSKAKEQTVDELHKEYTVLVWPYGEHPDSHAVNEALGRLHSVGLTPVVTRLEETGTLEYAWVVADRPLTQDEAYRYFAHWCATCGGGR